MSQPDLYTILDECVTRLRMGERVETCLAEYPAHADQLAPDLQLSAGLLSLSQLEASAESVERGRDRMMAAFDAREERKPLAALSSFINELVTPFRLERRSWRTVLLRAAAIVILLFIGASSLVISASADTLPGDTLYPIKRTWENTRLVFAMNASSRRTLQTEFERRRREEVNAVLDLRKPVVVEFKGTLQSFTAEVMLVGGLELTIGEDTKLIGTFMVGQKVSVQAQVTKDGSLVALRINGDETLSRPAATSTPTPLPSQTLLPTQTMGAPGPTATRGATQAEPAGADEATERPIRPTATPRPSATPLARDTATATPTSKPNDRPTEEPTSTLVPLPDRRSTATPLPTDAPPADSLATSVPQPSHTPETRVNVPTPTQPLNDAPSLSPSATATPRPNRDLYPTREPTATRNSDTGSGDHNNRPP